MFKVSVIIPTYNCASILMECLHSIRHQNYPQEMVEIIIVDGFSKDKTRQVAEKFGAVVLDNAFVIHPLGRPIGIRVATGNLILCLDSDNILPEKGWMQKMTAPFRDEEIIAAEPLYYVAEETDNVITKYCSLIGGDDPIVVYLGFHERYSYLAGVWTRVPVREEKKSSHLKVKFLDSSTIPSLGANGFIVRQEILRRVPFDPFYHVDVSHKIIERNDGYWAKVETGVIHRHGDTVKTFILKKKRRIE
ncbi:MAG: glycosyltransferase family 2 protein, partial [Nitrospinales bacterium]